MAGSRDLPLDLRIAKQPMLLSKEAQHQLRRNGYSRISLAGDLPPAAPLIPWKPGTKKAAQKIVK